MKITSISYTTCNNVHPLTRNTTQQQQPQPQQQQQQQPFLFNILIGTLRNR
jgi:hypothetical protein